MSNIDSKCTRKNSSAQRGEVALDKKTSGRKCWKAPELIDLSVENTHTKTVVNAVEGETVFKAPRGS